MFVDPRNQALRHARTCYDHLAGTLAVALADRMIARGHIELSPDGGALTEAGATFLSRLGVDLEATTKRKARIFCRPCLDWSERRPHLAGLIGTALCTSRFIQGWIRRTDGTRAVTITQKGQHTFRTAFGVDV